MSGDHTSEVWRIPPELDTPLPRHVRLSGTGITYCVLSLACIVFGMGMSARVVRSELGRQAANESLVRRMTAEGRETEATVTGLRTGLGYVVSYEYSVDDRKYEKNVFIASDHWQSLQVGSPLAIRYLPSDPAKSYPDRDPPNSQNHWSIVLPMAGVILLFMLGFAVIQILLVWPQLNLLSRGHPALGVVTQCRVSQGRRGRYVLYYDFPLANGTKCQGKGFSQSRLAENATVTVLYDSNRPRRNALHPMEKS